MDLFERLEKKAERIKNESKHKSLQVNPPKHHKRYGTKRPDERFDKQDIISSWRDDL